MRQHILDYQNSQKLKPENGGSESNLTKTQSEELCNHLQQHVCLYVKDIVVYVKATYQIDYTVSGMTHWLEQHQFFYKKPAVVPGKANREAQEKWIAEYEQLKKGLLSNETICFIGWRSPEDKTYAVCMQNLPFL
ncbi:MAG: winged helix-turn-helix domain-containing protein [Simkaniaceae bacterium]|nr:winged helix-turn-helix domain-containing protein [Simkaniaceae bacterium]